MIMGTLKGVGVEMGSPGISDKFNRLSRPGSVSVIIPTYNRAEQLIRCFISLEAQTYKDFEVLVCDDGSTDHTKQVVSDFQKRLSIRFFPGSNFGGPAKPRNLGVREAKGSYLAFLDSDDYWAPEKLERSIEELELGADLVYSNMVILEPKDGSGSTSTRKTRYRQVKVPVFANLLMFGNTVSCSSVVVRKEFIYQINGFSEDKRLIAAEDYDAWLKIAKLTDRFVFIQEALTFYSRGKDNISNDIRYIANCRALLELYKEDIASLSDEVPLWISFHLAMIYFRSRNFVESRRFCTSCFRAVRAYPYYLSERSTFFKLGRVLVILLYIKLKR